MKLVTIMSSLLAGGLLFGSAFSSADRGANPPTPPSPPSAQKSPKPPKPPKPPKLGKKGIHVQIDGLDDMITEQLDAALATLGKDKNIPPAVRDKVTKRLQSLQKKLRARVGNGSNLDPDELGELGEEIGREMEEFGREMEAWGEDFSKQMEKQFGNFDVHIGVGRDDDDDDDDDVADSDDDDLDDLDDVVRDIGKLNLEPRQREQIKKLRADSDAKVANAKRELARASEQLEQQLANPAVSEAEIARSIDNVTQHEAAIRKARILAWVNARRVLDDGQRKKVEGAAKKRSK